MFLNVQNFLREGQVLAGGMFVGGFIPKAAGLRAGELIHYSLVEVGGASVCTCWEYYGLTGVKECWGKHLSRMNKFMEEQHSASIEPSINTPTQCGSNTTRPPLTSRLEDQQRKHSNPLLQYTTHPALWLKINLRKNKSDIENFFLYTCPVFSAALAIAVTTVINMEGGS